MTGEAGGASILTWSINYMDLESFVGSVSMMPGDTRNFSGGMATLTDVSSSGFTSTLVIYSAGDGVVNQTIIGCRGSEISASNLTLNIACKFIK